MDFFKPAACPTCNRDMAASVSDDFCGEDCQRAWYHAQAVPLELPAYRYGVTPAGDAVRVVGGSVPTRAQVAAMHTRVRRLIPSSEETLAALARVAAGLRRLA